MDEVTTREAADLLGLKSTSTVVRYVYEGRLTPSRKLPGPNGAYLFERADVLRFRDDEAERRAERTARLANLWGPR